MLIIFRSQKAFTLVETLIVAAMVAMIMGALAFIFQVVSSGWSGQGSRAGLDADGIKAASEITGDVRNAMEVACLSSGEIRFSSDGTNYFIYYLYNPLDSYPSQFDRDSYQLKKSALSGGINGSFVYGSGDLVARDILPPPASSFSFNGKEAVVDMGLKRGTNSIRSAVKVKPRNI